MAHITIDRIVEIIRFTFDEDNNLMIRCSIPHGTTNHNEGFDPKIIVILNSSLILHYNFFELATYYAANELSSFLINEKERLKSRFKL